MPPRPLITSIPIQRGVVAVAMAILFAISIGAAYVLSLASAEPSGPSPHQTIRLGGLELELPAAWTRDGELEKSVTQRLQAEASACFVDPSQPTRRLIVMRERMETAPNRALQRAIEALIPAPTLGSLQHVTYPAQLVALRTLHGLKYIGFSRSPTGDSADGYYIAVLTFDLKTYWVLAMTDHVVSTNDINTAVASDNKIFDQIVLSARVDVQRQRSDGETP